MCLIPEDCVTECAKTRYCKLATSCLAKPLTVQHLHLLQHLTMKANYLYKHAFFHTVDKIGTQVHNE